MVSGESGREEKRRRVERDYSMRVHPTPTQYIKKKEKRREKKEERDYSMRVHPTQYTNEQSVVYTNEQSAMPRHCALLSTYLTLPVMR